MARRRDRLAVWREKTVFGILKDVGNFLLFAMRRFVADGMSQAAGALTYSTLLALVPLLVIAFSVLSGFPAFDSVKLKMEDLVLGILVPEVGVGAKSYLTEFTHNATNLTAVGIVALTVAAVLLLSTIEGTLNRIWRVERPRPLSRRLLIFWAVLTVGPLLFGASFTLTSDLMTTAQEWAWNTDRPEATIWGADAIRSLVAIVMQSAAFTLLFLIVPARHVYVRDAVIGGVFSGIALQCLRYGFNVFLTSSATYTTIYGAVAIFPIFLLWLYSCWTVVILGAVLAASFPDWWRRRDPMVGLHLTPADRLEVAVALLAVLGSKARTGGSVSMNRLAEAVPIDARDEILEILRAKGYLVVSEEERYSLARDLHHANLADLASDLGVSLGRPTSNGSSPERLALTIRMDKVVRSLAELCEAEKKILGKPIAGVIATACEPSESASESALRIQPN